MITHAVNNAATLSTALSIAQSGDRIELAAGDYGSLSITGVTFSSDVTIVSADPENPATVRGFNISDSGNIVFDGILFDYVVGSNPIWTKPFYIYGSHFITIRNSVFDGDEIPSTTGGSGTYGTGFGFWAQNSDNIVVENNEFYKFWKALTFINSTNMTFRANDVHTVLSDGLNVISVDGVLIEGNWFHDFKTDPTSGNHPDMIQFWTTLGFPSVRNVIIRGNFLDAGTGAWTQSIFIGTGIAGGGDDDDVYKNILIEDNVIYNDHLHGIMVGKVDGLVVNNNTLLDDPNVISPLGWPPRINLDVAALNVTVQNNILADVWNWNVTVDHPGWTVGNNLLAQNTDSALPNYYGELFVNPFATPATLADLRAKAGGVIEAGAIGAAMTRADIPLFVGPYATEPVSDPVPPETSTCEADLADALTVVSDLEVQLALMTTIREVLESERDTALALQDLAEAALVGMTAERDEALTALATTSAALFSMTAERDAATSALNVATADLLIAQTSQALAESERDAALLSESAAIDDLGTAQTQLAVAAAKLDAIRAILEG